MRQLTPNAACMACCGGVFSGQYLTTRIPTALWLRQSSLLSHTSQSVRLRLCYLPIMPSTPTNPSIDGPTKLPGFGLPVDDMPDWKGRFPHAIADNRTTKAITFRERRMLNFINQITDKPEWNCKAFDKSIVSKWREEASKELDDDDDVILSEPMFDYVGLPCRARLIVVNDYT
jgi:hypothetical protein